MTSVSPFDPFNERRKSLEEAFFKERDQQLLNKLRSEFEAFEEKNKIAHVSGIMDPQVLKDLVEAGVRAETMLAMRLVPVVEVAWSDGSLSPEERAAVLNAAASLDIHPGTAPYEMLSRWLQERPDPRLAAAWKEYVKELARVLPAGSLAELKRQTLDRCRRVAEAAGGFLGIGTISRSEQAKIDEFTKAWNG